MYIYIFFLFRPGPPVIHAHKLGAQLRQAMETQNVCFETIVASFTMFCLVVWFSFWLYFIILFFSIN